MNGIEEGSMNRTPTVRAQFIAPSSAARIALRALDELWIHTGTACNLECPFCLEGSRPGDIRLERIKLPEIKPMLDAAVQLGVQRFCFTGGEPLIVKDIVKILEYALSLRPCLVLTNGTAPLLKRLHQLELLKKQLHPLSFRVSLDYPDEQQHDTARGWGNFRRAVEGLQLLHAQGFVVSIARQMTANENAEDVTERFRQLLRKAQLPADLPVLPLPDFARPGVESRASVSDGEVNTSSVRESLMCARSRMLVKREGRLRVYACALTDDDPRFELGDSLAQALETEIELKHHRCAQCVRCAGTL